MSQAATASRGFLFDVRCSANGATMFSRRLHQRVLSPGLLLLLGSCAGCWSDPDVQRTVVVYTALDREFSEPLLNEFTKATGIRVLAKYDDESTKTIGLTNALIQESSRPRCDVFWNNEILNTLRLERKELLAAYESPVGKDYPDMYRSRERWWHGFAARARILIVNTNLVTEDARPKSIFDLADKKWKGRIGIARPVAGTTATHIACLFAALGEKRAKDFLRELRGNGVLILGGNKQVAQACAAGQIAIGLTDTDDAIIEVERGAPVMIVYPDREPEEIGTLFIPNTLAIIRNGPHPDHARRLVDFLLSPAAEERLARGASAQIPLNVAVKVPTRVETPLTVKAMVVDFLTAADQYDEASRFIQAEFLAN
jgi:iron(III) transport system substrate-binding protein